MKRDHAYKMMAASEVAANLYTISIQNLPESESHIRPLTSLAPEEQQIVWDVVQQTAPRSKVSFALYRCSFIGHHEE